MKNIFLISFLLLFAGGELGRINPSPYITIYLHDFLVIVYLFLNINHFKIIIKKFKKNKKFNKKIYFLLFTNIFLAIIYAIWQKSFEINSFFYIARAIAYLLFIVLLKLNFGKNKITQIFLGASFLILILGFIQYIFLPDLTSLYYLGFDDHFYRLTSTLFDPNFTGLLLVFNTLYYLHQTALKKKNIFLILLFLLALALTYSRASYLSFILAGLFLFIKSQKNQKLLIGLSMFFLLLTIPFLPRKSGGEGVKLERTSSIKARVNSAQQYLNSNQNLSIIFGQGPFQPQYQNNKDGLISHARFADNFLIFLYNSFGIFGALLIIILITQEVGQRWKKRHYWQISLLIAFFTHSLFNNNLSQAFISLIFWGFYL